MYKRLLCLLLGLLLCCLPALGEEELEMTNDEITRLLWEMYQTENGDVDYTVLPDDYQPQQLVNMRDYCDSSIVSIKGSEIEGEQIAVDALLAMLMQAQSEGLTSWQISAGYRSVAYQQKLFDDKVYSYRQQGMTGAQARSAARKLVADPGCSEHHTGLAFDITVPGTSFGGTKQAKWLEEHCWEWGFILRYPADKTAITGITNEPWHFRYVGVDAAMEMHETGECLEEYVERKQSE